jgi:hypothetical protein
MGITNIVNKLQIPKPAFAPEKIIRNSLHNNIKIHFTNFMQNTAGKSIEYAD